MPKLKLTKTNIDTKAKPSPTGDVFYFDTETRGFGLRVSPKGVKTFVAQGRVRGATSDIRITIGTYGAWLIDSYDDRDARRKANELRQQFEDGIDPREVRKQEAAQKVTLGTVATAYLSRPDKLKPTSEKWTRYYVEKVFADWTDKPITSITRDMVRDRHAQLAEGGFKGLNPEASSKDKRKARPAPATANAAMIVLRILIAFAADEYRLADGKSLITDNPVDAMKRHWAPAGDRTGRYIDKRKVGDVWNALHAERVKPMTATMQNGIAKMEQELSAPVQARAAHTIAVEIRNHVRAMDSGKLHAFIRQAIVQGDEVTVSSVLGAPPYLSGLTPEFQQVYTRMWHEQANPLIAKRMRAMQGALDLLGTNATLITKELERAIGVPQFKVKQYREAKAKADKAFAG